MPNEHKLDGIGDTLEYPPRQCLDSLRRSQGVSFSKLVHMRIDANITGRCKDIGE
jgi:hypothetical protein